MWPLYDNLTVTIHAFERMEQRWPDLCRGLNDEEIAWLILGEINDAYARKRISSICPLELANSNIARWKAEKNLLYLWTQDKTRGYVVADRDDGVTVLTTLVGQDREVAKHKLQRH